jgi:hypothetical protein
VKVRAPESDRHVVVHALLDSGSTNTFSTRHLANQLGLKGEEQSLRLTTLDRQDSEVKTTAINLEIASLDNDTFFPLDNVFTRDMIPIKEDNIAVVQDLREWSHLSDLDTPSAITEVMLLIGQDNPDILLPREVRSGAPGAPYATRSLLGWTINGPLGLDYNQHKQSVTANFIGVDETLTKQVERFWKVDDFDSIADQKSTMSIEDQHAVEVWNKSITQNDTGHYTLDVPFRTWPPLLCNNRDLAERRLDGLKRRLYRDNELAKLYREGMQKLLDEGHAEAVSDEQGPKNATWYLPHHPVLHPQKPGRVRIVFDCAATHNNTSLNDKVMQGPDLTNSLLGVMLHFRREQIVVKADIEGLISHKK